MTQNKIQVFINGKKKLLEKNKNLIEVLKLLKITKNGIYVNTIDYMIVITNLQFPNKKKISALDAYNSYLPFFK